jgi:uncharacterized metal-binding protein
MDFSILSFVLVIIGIPILTLLGLMLAIITLSTILFALYVIIATPIYFIWSIAKLNTGILSLDNKET